MKSMMVNMKASQEHLIERIDQMDKEKSSGLKNLEIQMANLATSLSQRQAGHLPPQPSHNGGTLNAITTRSGASYAPPPMPRYIDLGVEDELLGAKDMDPDAEVVAEKVVQFVVPPKLKLRDQGLQTQSQADRATAGVAGAGTRSIGLQGQCQADRASDAAWCDAGTASAGSKALQTGYQTDRSDAKGTW